MDEILIRFLNQFSTASPLLDRFVVFLSDSDLVKGGVVFSVFWAVWFTQVDREEKRSRLLATLAGALLALLVARVLAHSMPLRIRPVLSSELHFVAPTGLPNQSNWTGWSSFPSDHAAMFAAVAFGVWEVARRPGFILLIYCFLLIALPRIYVGIHYPTDIVAGATLGILAVAFLEWEPMRTRLIAPCSRWVERYPAVSYFVLFLLTFEMACLFWDMRVALSSLGFSV